jgi:hypothetical protein
MNNMLIRVKTIALLLFAAAPLVASSADLTLTSAPPSTLIRAGVRWFAGFTVHNAGPDVATNVVVTATSTIDLTCDCSLGNIPAGQSRTANVQFPAPDTPGPFTINATVASGASDPNPSDNSASQTLTVSPDPDVTASLSAPAQQDLGLPFTLSIFLNNIDTIDAHDVDLTIDFRPDAAVQSLPTGCSNTIAGRIVCHLDTLPFSIPQPAFKATVVAPATYGSGSIVFTATATEREHDFDAASNTRTITVQLYDTEYVTTTADDGAGSLRQAILDANAHCDGTTLCAIAFRIAEASTTAWKTIRVNSPLPMLAAPGVRVDGATQTGFFGDTNVDGPEIEISGGGTIDGDGLIITSCSAEIANLAINGFLRNGLSVIATPETPACPKYSASTLHDLYIGTDPTGSQARPNARGIGISVPNGTSFNSALGATTIYSSVISGNTHSGVFGLSGRLNVSNNRIGVKAHSDEPLPNGASGILVGAGGYGSDIGAGGYTIAGENPASGSNVIAFNGESGVSVAGGVADVAIRDNRIWGNKLLGIDVGLDGPTPDGGNGTIAVPVLTLAHYDPVSGKTVIEGDLPKSVTSIFNAAIHFYANDTGDPSGYGEGQRSLGSIQVATPPHFHFEAAGDLTGQFISATATRINYVGFAKPEGISEGLLTQTSEFSRWLEVR